MPKMLRRMSRQVRFDVSEDDKANLVRRRANCVDGHLVPAAAAPHCGRSGDARGLDAPVDDAHDPVAARRQLGVVCDEENRHAALAVHLAK